MSELTLLAAALASIFAGIAALYTKRSADTAREVGEASTRAQIVLVDASLIIPHTGKTIQLRPIFENAGKTHALNFFWSGRAEVSFVESVNGSPKHNVAPTKRSKGSNVSTAFIGPIFRTGPPQEMDEMPAVNFEFSESELRLIADNDGLTLGITILFEMTCVDIFQRQHSWHEYRYASGRAYQRGRAWHLEAHPFGSPKERWP